MLFECYVKRGYDGLWYSAGTAETTIEDLLTFFSREDERLQVSAVVREDPTTVQIIRSYRLSGAEAEKTICILDTPEDADALVSQIKVA